MSDIAKALEEAAGIEEIYGIQYATDMRGNGPDAWLPNIVELANDIHRWSEMLKAGDVEDVAAQLNYTKKALALALHRKW